MQPRDAAITLGPDDIAGIRTKARSFLQDEKTDKSAKSPDPNVWYVLADQDIDMGRRNKRIKRYKWTKVGSNEDLLGVLSFASQQHVQLIHTKNPPKDVR